MIDLINKIFSYKKNLSYKSKRFRNLKEKNGIKKIFSTIESYSENSEIRYVGGCIRKIINNEVVEDIDLAVNLEVAVEQGWSKTECLEHLAQKAGCDKDAWMEARFEVFTSKYVSE